MTGSTSVGTRRQHMQVALLASSIHVQAPPQFSRLAATHVRSTMTPVGQETIGERDKTTTINITQMAAQSHLAIVGGANTKRARRGVEVEQLTTGKHGTRAGMRVRLRVVGTGAWPRWQDRWPTCVVQLAAFTLAGRRPRRFGSCRRRTRPDTASIATAPLHRWQRFQRAPFVNNVVDVSVLLRGGRLAVSVVHGGAGSLRVVTGPRTSTSIM